MPLYKYKCSCGKETTVIRDFNKRLEPLKCDCGSNMSFCLPSSTFTSAKKTIDKHRNVRVNENVEEQVRKRAKKYFVENEVAALIEEHGLETAQKMGWVKKDGKKVSKDDVK